VGAAIQQPSRHEMRWLLVGFLCISVLVTVGFGPALGAGFAKDDFGWLWYSRIDELSDLRQLVPVPESGDCFVFEDDRGVQPNLHDAFSENLPFALALAYDQPPWEKAFYATAIDDNALLSCDGLWRLRYLGTGESPESRVLELVSAPAAS